MRESMTQEDAINMDNEQAIQILKPLRDMMRDQHGCPISDAYFAINKAIEALSHQLKWNWIKTRPLTEEEKEEHPEWSFMLEGLLPDDGQRILVNCVFRGHESVQMDEYYDEGGSCYLDSGYELGEEVNAWMPLPDPPKEDETWE